MTAETPVVRIPRHAAAATKSLGDWLVDQASRVLGDRYAQQHYAAVLVLVGPNGPEVTWRGIRWEHELRDAIRALEDASHPGQAERRAKWEVEQAAAAEAFKASHPFVCDRGGYCTDRFATMRGLEAHRRSATKRAAQGRDYQHAPRQERVVEPLRPRPVPDL